jgi:hypothetical protein
MEDGGVELKRAKRRRLTTNAINRQKRIAKSSTWHNSKLLEQPHRMAKHHALDCGQPGCVVCGNPRKIWKQKTLQERKFIDGEEVYSRQSAQDQSESETWD